MYGVNLIEDLLFWTDNRNQPRKINIDTAISNPGYYTTEDHVSVAKYYPYQPIDLWKNEVIGFTLTNPGTSYSDGFNVSTSPGGASPGTGSGLTVNTRTTLGVITTLTINSLGLGYVDGETVIVSGTTGVDAIITLSVNVISTMQDVVSVDLPTGNASGTNPNPLYNSEWPGDPDYLKERFARFSYRFKFDDGEYSLIAPFTQECFIPQQDGYFLDELYGNTVNDEIRAYQSTEVAFMQNKVNNIKLILNSPGSGGWDQIETEFKITEVDILYKESDQTTIRVVDTIPANVFNIETTSFLQYEYQSIKPWKTLPSKDIVRVYDQVPIRALAQEVVGNRVVYGNYIDKATPPISLEYSASASRKTLESVSTYTGGVHVSQKEYQNHTLKQNRTYQVGVVLCDRYGRQSTVVLSTYDDDETRTGSTVFNPFKGINASIGRGFSYFPLAVINCLLSATDTWPGDSLKATFQNTISSVRSSTTGEPGLYDSTTNPLGWYTFKIVVKQADQEYYNVYFPGILNGYIDGESKDPTSGSVSEPVCHFALHGDNISKIPRDLSLLGPTQVAFRSGRPSAKEDPSYYEFVDTSGNQFTVDPYSEEGERLLKERDRERDLDSGSQITNASIKLSPRVVNTGTTSTKQSYPGALTDTVVTIGTGTELGLWDPAANQPYNTAPVFYGYNNNPYIAKAEVSDYSNTDKNSIGVTGPSPDAGKLIYNINSVHHFTAGADYISGSKNISTEQASALGGTGVLLNIDGVIVPSMAGTIPTGIPGSVGTLWGFGNSIANEDGEGIKGYTVGNHTLNVVGAGNSSGAIGLTVTKQTWPGLMSPILTIHETEPIESKLDIYWETSTGGLVSDLNTAILTSDTWTPVGFGDSVNGKMTYKHKESAALNSYVVHDSGGGFHIYAINYAGNPTSSPSTFVLASVIDGLGNERKSEFALTNVDPSFYITTNAYFMYGKNATTKENYTFYITYTVPGETYATDGALITGTMQLGYYNAGVFTPTNCQLSNVNPSFTTCPLSATGSLSGGLITTLAAVNGSNILGTLEFKALSFSITSGSSDIYLANQDIVNGTIEVHNIPTATVSYPIIVTVTDGGGATATCSFTITLS